jgi:hypothetical protein
LTPGDIGPHPDAPNHYTKFGKPTDWKDEDCGSLGVRRLAATGEMFYEPAARIVRDELPSGEFVYPAFLSEWYPTPDEIERIVAGQPVRCLIAGNGLQPMSLWARNDGEV